MIVSQGTTVQYIAILAYASYINVNIIHAVIILKNL